MSRIKAAFSVLANFYWSHRQTDIFTRPIYLQGTNNIVGYFDRISVRHGQMQLDGWVNTSNLNVETDSNSLDIRPDLKRSDVADAGDTPGFSVTVRGCHALKYSAGSGQKFSNVKIGGWFSVIKSSISFLFCLALFAIHQRKDIWAFFAYSDALAGDRLEMALQAKSVSRIRPAAAKKLFGRCPLPRVVDSVDIIVPIYNAHKELLRCLDCLATHTDRRHRVILVDDASTDLKIGSLIHEWASRHDNIRLIINTRNIGFVGSVNKALALSTGHVVLLNTDAFVGPKWLERLLAPMQNDDSVASVTPLSNAAEILSIPFFRERNKINPIQARAVDAALAKLNWKTACCEVPTGVGFCMLMSRRWLDLVPTFDPAFGKGYGEEVDWCQKVAKLGGKNIGHGGLFVEHIGASSFTKTSAQLKAKHQQILSTRFPKFDQMVQEFRQTDPLIGSRLVAALALIDDGAPMPVYLAHDSGGGADLWLAEEIKSQASRGRTSVVVRGRPKAGHIKLEIHFGGREVSGLIPREDLSMYLHVLGQINLIYSCLALTSKPLELLNICRKNLRPADTVKVLFHDFFPVCPSHNLIGHDGAYCGLPLPETCNACYAKLSRLNSEWPASLDEWRMEWLRLLQRSDQIVTFSESTRDHVLLLWPHLRPKISVEPHSMDWLPATMTPPRSGRIVVGVLGSIGYQKGAEVLRGLAEAANGAFDIVVIGHFDPSFGTNGIKVHGDYAREDIETLANGYGVTCWIVPSIWPETFCYAARESLATGLPVFGFDIGAQGQAISAAPNGTLLPFDCSTNRIRSAILAQTSTNQPAFFDSSAQLPNTEKSLRH